MQSHNGIFLNTRWSFTKIWNVKTKIPRNSTDHLHLWTQSKLLKCLQLNSKEAQNPWLMYMHAHWMLKAGEWLTEPHFLATLTSCSINIFSWNINDKHVNHNSRTNIGNSVENVTKITTPNHMRWLIKRKRCGLIILDLTPDPELRQQVHTLMNPGPPTSPPSLQHLHFVHHVPRQLFRNYTINHQRERNKRHEKNPWKNTIFGWVR